MLRLLQILVLGSAPALGQTVEQRPDHLWVNKDLFSFAEGQGDGDLDAVGIVKPAPKMDQ